MRTFYTLILTISLGFLTQSNAFAQSEVNWMSLEEAVVAQKNEPRKIVMDVYTQWCGPCKMIAPVLDELASTYAGKISIAKMDVDDSKETPAKFNIRGIPTLIIFKNGEASSTKVGALTKKQLIEFIEASL